MGESSGGPSPPTCPAAHASSSTFRADTPTAAAKSASGVFGTTPFFILRSAPATTTGQPAPSTSKGDAHGLEQFNESLVPYSAGILKPVSPQLHVSATVGARQPMKAFGKNNCNRDGGMVSDAGDTKIVREEVVLALEMRPEFQPIE